MEERVLEGELLYLAGRSEEAREVFEEALREAPGDPQVQAWAERAAEGPAAAVEATGASAAEPSGPPPVEEELDPATVCDALFDPSYTSIDTSRVFDERFAGKRVRWTGTARSADAFSYDFVLGSEPGTKLVLEVHEIGSSFYGESKIQAVTRLPPEAAEELRDRVGGSLTIEGTLLKVDGFMKNVYLQEGRIVPAGSSEARSS